MPDVFQRSGRDDYESQGRAAAFEVARERAIELTNAKPPEGLPDELHVKEIKAVVAAADVDIIGKVQGHSGKREVI
ncbi:MAG: hypothetical protein V3U76_19395 [Granulosicoccus sp.]